MIVKNFLSPAACQSSDKMLSLKLKICQILAIFQGDGSTNLRCMKKIPDWPNAWLKWTSEILILTADFDCYLIMIRGSF